LGLFIMQGKRKSRLPGTRRNVVCHEALISVEDSSMTAARNRHAEKAVT